MSDITLDLTYAFYSGVGSSVDVPHKWDVALGGRGYMLDDKHPSLANGITTIPLIRTQADTSREPGEATINPEDLWPRSQTTWHKGAGQLYLDAEDSDRARFHSSIGIDPWTRGQITLQHDVEHPVASVNVNQQLLRVGDRVYRVDGNDVKFAPAIGPYSAWTDTVVQNGEAAQSVKRIASDGYHVWAALGSNGIHVNNRGASTTAHYSDLSCTLVAYVKGRLMAANGQSIYNVIAAGAAPSALLTHPNTDWTWVDFAEGTAVIYAAGYSGDKSLIYRTAVKADGTALDAPIVAGELPDGEIVRSIQGYLGFLVVGTDDGFRIALQDSSGNLTFGALVKTDSPCRAFEPQENFMWFGWDNYDASRTGIGRIDLSIQTDSGAPAYASDLMAGTEAAVVQGAVQSVITDANGDRLFVVSGKGLYVQADTYVASGTIDSGLFDFGLPDAKIALRFALKHKPLPDDGSVEVEVTADDGERVSVGISALAGTTSSETPMKIPEVAAQQFESHLTLVGDGTTLERYDFRAYPTSDRGSTVEVPLLLHERVVTGTESTETVDVVAEFVAIQGYVGTDRLITYQELSQSFSVLVEGIKHERKSRTEDRSWWNGTLVLKLKLLGD